MICDVVGKVHFGNLALIVLVSCSLPLVAQVQLKRLVRVTVTDSSGHLVNGLEQERFEVIENGVRRPVTEFSDDRSPMAVAVVSERPPAVSGFDRSDDELIQTPSLPEALRQLAASKISRKTLVLTTKAAMPTTRADIQVVRSDPDDLSDALVQVRNQYFIEFESADASGDVEVVLQAPAGMGRLQANLR